jgi:uncharacterized protein (TIGR03067 family)
MRRSLALVLFGLWAAALPGAPPEEKESAREELRRLQGTWVPLKAELGGVPVKALEGAKLTIKDNTYRVTAGKETDEGVLELMPGKSPKAMDVKGTKGPNMGKTFPAIYEVKGDTLRVCYDLDGKERPKAFRTEKGKKYFLVTYERSKP